MADIIMYDAVLDEQRVATQDDWDQLLAAARRLRENLDTIRAITERRPTNREKLESANG